MAAYRSLEDRDHFCAMLGCYVARAPGDFHCCPGHLHLAAQMSDRPFRFYGGFSDKSERNACCTSLLDFKSNQIPTGVPDLDHIDNLFNRLPWNAGDMFEVQDHHDRCAFLFFKQKPESYQTIYKDRVEEMRWRGNGKRKVIQHNGADLTIEGVSLRFSGVISLKLKNRHPGWWMLTHFLYRGHSLYCMSYERRAPRDAEDEDRGSDDEEEDADGKDDDDKKNAKEAEKHPWISSFPKRARTTITRPRNMSSFVVFGRNFTSNHPNLLASGTDDGISWSRKVQQVSSSTSYDGTAGVIAMKCKSPGADDGEICVWGLPKFSEPFHFPLLKGIGSATQGGNPWNRKVQQVSSSTSYDGTTGVFAIEWCPSSSSYLLTCAKGKQTTFWYTNTSVGLYGVEENHFGTAPLRAPKWYKHSVGFGGKLGASAKGASTIQSEVSLQSLVTEQSLGKQTSEFEEEKSSGSAPDDVIHDEVAEEKDQAVDGLSADLNGSGLEDAAVHAAAETHEMLEEEKGSSGPALDDDIQCALVVGDHKEVVVDQSKSANKMAVALVGGRAVLVGNI